MIIESAASMGLSMNDLYSLTLEMLIEMIEMRNESVSGSPSASIREATQADMDNY